MHRPQSSWLIVNHAHGFQFIKRDIVLRNSIAPPANHYSGEGPIVPELLAKRCLGSNFGDSESQKAGEGSDKSVIKSSVSDPNQQVDVISIYGKFCHLHPIFLR